MFTAFSVPKIWVPTQFQVLDAEHNDRCNLAGCENCRVSPLALEAISNPDPEWLRDHWLAQDDTLRRTLGDFHGVAPGQVFLTSGAIGGIRYSFEVFTRSGTHVGLMRPEWPGFRFYAEHNRTRISYVDQLAFPFHFRASDLIDIVRREEIEFLILSNPSAVTGYLWEPDEVRELLAGCPETLFVIDEADAIYPDLSGAHLVEEHDNGLFLMSFSKFYGLSGLRIGYLVTPAAYADHFEQTINPAELASVSIVAAREAFRDTAYHQETQRTVQRNLAKLTAAVDAGDFQLVDESRCFAAYLWADEAVEDPRDFLDGQGIDIVAGEMFGLERGGRVNLADADGIDTLTAVLGSRAGVGAAPVTSG
jgi:histidinol-phosphate/aromatic aminotransferase/cobyric acid decarboxylase-like protein